LVLLYSVLEQYFSYRSIFLEFIVLFTGGDMPHTTVASRKQYRFSQVAVAICTAAVLILTMLWPQGIVNADAPTLSVEVITWNIIGLDSNDPVLGPQNFPIGVQVCNTTDSVVSNVGAVWHWDGDNSGGNIDLRSSSLTEYSGINLVASLGAHACHDFYFEVHVNPVSAAYDKWRNFHVTATINGTADGSSPVRQLYVEHLISQSRNSTSSVTVNGQIVPAGGTVNLIVGNTYEIVLTGSTATNGYNQLESFINFPSTVFRILSVSTNYFTENSPYISNPHPSLYGDACLWDSNQNSPTYNSCIGEDGKVGNTITVTYQLQIIGGGGTTQELSNLIYDFSGSSFHYNADYSFGGRVAAIIDPTLLTITKSFSPGTTVPNAATTLTFTINNTNAAALSGVSFTDNLPTTPGAMVVANPPNASTTNCGSATFAPTAGSASLSFSNGTIPANGSCTVSVNVVAPVVGTYSNTSEYLHIGSFVTSSRATASLVVGTAPAAPSCTANLVLAQWSMAATTNPPTNPDIRAGNVLSASASAGTGITSSIATTGNPANSWQAYGFSNAFTYSDNDYFQFSLDTSGYTNISLTFDHSRRSPGPKNIQVYYSTTGSEPFTPIGSAISTSTSWTRTTVNLSGLTNTSGITYFRIYGYGANNPNTGSELLIDNITFTTSCGVPGGPTITKTFTPSTVAVNGTSTLLFTIANSYYTYNTGTGVLSPLTLSGITFTDSLPSGLAVASTPGMSTTCTGSPSWTYSGTTLTFGSPTSASLAGGASCTATVNVTASTLGPHNNISSYIYSTQSGNNIGPGGTASASLNAIQAPVIAKSFSPDPILVGQTSTLTITVTNPNPSDALTNVSFIDDLPLGLTDASTPASTCGATPTMSTVGSQRRITLSGGSLAAGASCTITLTVTPSGAGDYVNTTGNVSAASVGNGNTATDTLHVQPVHPRLTIIKQVSTSSSGPWYSYIGVAADTPVYYRFVVENTGDVPLTSVHVTDPTLASYSADLSGCTWPSMAVTDLNECVVGPVPYHSGPQTNTATAVGTYSSTNDVTSLPDTAAYATEGITLTKSVEEAYYAAENDVLHYNFLVTNSGSGALFGPVSIDDPMFTTVTCPELNTVGDLDEFFDGGEEITCTATYSVTATDVDAGSIVNTATATVDGIDSNPSSVTIYVNLPDLQVTKENDTSDVVLINTPFIWTLTVSNPSAVDAVFEDGETILRDPLPAGAAYSVLTNPANTACTIDGSRVLTCSASGSQITVSNSGSLVFTIQVTPSVGGSLDNTVTVDHGSLIAEVNETNNTASDSVFVQDPSLDLVKNITAGDPYSAIGDTIDYEYIVTNDGNISLDGPVTVDDDQATVTCPSVTTLDPGDSVTCTASHTVTLLDISTGSITNTATAHADGIDSDPAQATATLSIIRTLSLVKNITGGDPYATVGSAVDYEYIVTNTGNVALAGPVTVDDDQATVTCPSVTTLDPGDSVTCSASHTVTQSDLNAGSLTNTATAHADSVDSNTTSATATADQNPSLHLVKDITSGDPYASTGSSVGYEYIVSNDGNITLDGPVTVDDDQATVTCPVVASLDPGDSVTCTASHTVTLADLNAGSLTNTATAHADGVDSNTATATAAADQNPSLHLVKNITIGETYSTAGSTIDYEYIVSNDGNVTLDGPVTVDDDQASVTCPAVVILDPGDSVTCTASHTITLADLNAGSLTNTATAHADGVNSNTATATATADQNPSLLLVKSITTGNSYSATSDTVEYQYIVTNNGNITLDGPVTVDDDHAAVSCPAVASLDPGDSVTCTASYSISQSDIDTGSVTNTATAHADGVDSNTDTATATADQNPSLNLVKNITAGDPYSVEGDSVDYEYIVTNNGNVTLHGPVTVDDDQATVTCPSTAQLAPGESVTCIASHTIVQADIDNGSLTNTATAHEDGVDSNTTTATATADQNPSISLTKNIVGGDPYSVVGSTVDYEYTITNTGNVSLYDTPIVDDDQTTVSCPADVLLIPGTTVICSASHTITQSDIDAGSVTNTATAHMDGQDSNTTSATAYAVQSPELTLVKSITVGDPYNTVGGSISYEYLVTNSGNITLFGAVTVDDDLTTVTCPSVTALAPGGSITCTAAYSVTQSDLNNGSVTNTATAHQDGIDSNPSTATATADQNPSLNLVKNITSGNPYSVEGAEVDYEYIVTNDGDITLDGPVTIDDDQATVTCPVVSSLNPGDSVTCSASHTISQADIDAGSLTNTATAHADGVDSNTATATANATQTPELTLVKNITSGDPYAAAGDVIDYEYVVTNTGNITLHGAVTVDDDQTIVTCPFVAQLAPSESVTCTASHTVTQANVDNGSLTNIATAHEDGVDSNTATATATASMNPSLELVKSITSGNTYSVVGSTIEYQYVVTNNGNVTLNGAVTIDDDHVSVTCPSISSLAPSDSVTCTATYTVTLADLNTGSVTNTATAHADGVDSNTDTATATADQIPSLNLVKNITAGDPYSVAGTSIDYEYIVINNGNITLHGDVTVDDDQATVSCPTVTQLDPGDSVTCTASHTVTLADLNAGSLTNTATAHQDSVDSNTTTATATANQNPSLHLDKNITAGDPYSVVGSTVDYEYIVTNDGNTTLYGSVTVDDDQAAVTCPTVTQLDPGDSVTCTASHTISQADIDAGSLTNTATAHQDGVDSNTATATATANQNPSLNLVKNITAGDPYTATGAAIEYEYIVSNDGNITLDGPVTVNDDQATVTCPVVSTLVPGDSVTCTASHTITQADIDAGSLTNTATAHADGVDSNTATATAMADQNPSLDLVKTITSGDPYSAVGATIEYQYVVTNNGNITLNGAVTVDDNVTSVSCPSVISLTPGASVTCTASYTVTLTDLNAGSITNTATAHENGVDSNTTNATATADQNPSLDLVKNITAGNPYSANGASVDYEYIVTNNGNITLHGDVSVDDDQATVSCPTVIQLDPGDSVTCTASHTVTQADLNAGSLTNTATAHEDGADSNTVTATATADQNLSLYLVKNITSGNLYSVDGSAISYEYIVTNDGNVSLDGPVTVDDDQATVSCPSVAVLDPGDSITCTASHTVTLADLNAGSLTNTATAHADGVDSNMATATANAIQTPSLDLVKNITSGDPYAVVGDPVNYEYIVTNNGNITLHGAVTVDDDQATVTCPSVTQLDPGGSVTCTASHTVTLVDLNAGSITNTATAHEDGVDSNTAYATATAFQAPSLDLVKNITAGDPYYTVGSTVEYEYIVTNDGNITLYGAVSVDDDQATVTCPVVTQLEPGDSITCTASHTVTQADIDAGSLTNMATALEDGVYSNTTSATATADQTPSLDLVKNITAGNPYSVDGGSIDYEYIVTNDGNITLYGDVTVDDDQATVTCPSVAALAPGDSTTCTASHTVTLADLNAGSLTNTATAHQDSVDSNTTTATATADQNPSLALVKSITSGDPYALVGDVIEYEYLVTNDGNITLYGAVTVDDDLTTVSCPSVTQMDPGDSVTCTASYSVTLGDISNGSVENTATAHEDGIDSNTSSATATAYQNPEVTLVKSIGTAASGPWSESITVDLYDDVYYQFEITNSGNVPFTNLSITDANVSTSGCVFTATLNPDDSTTCVVGPISAGAGTNINTATAHGDFDGTTYNSGPDSATYFGQNPSVSIVKQVSTNGSGDWNDDSVTVTIGDTVYYQIILSNNGNIPLNNVSVGDDQCTLSAPSGDTNSNNILDLTEQWVYTCSVTADAGIHTNTASITTTEIPSALTDTASYFGQDPSIGIAKDVTSVTFISTGTYQVEYSLRIHNYGNTTVNNIEVSDDLTDTFPAGTSFEVVSVTSPTLTVNSGYNGSSDIQLLDGTDSLDSTEDGAITLVVEIIPDSQGPFNNSAYVSAYTSLEVHVTDQSQDGLNPDLDGDGDPTNDNEPTPVTIVPTVGNLYDPPMGIKTYDANNIPVLNWTMVWINNSNLVGINASVHDPISDGTTYVASGLPSGYPLPATYPDESTNVGISCTDTSGITTTTRCYYEGPTLDHPLGQVIWEGFIGPDYGITDPNVSVNDIHISFNVTVADDVFSVQNEATVDSDLNGNLVTTDPGEQRVASASDAWTASSAVNETTALPATGFAPGIQTVLPEQPADMAYTDLNGLWLEIPDLDMETSIVGIPATLSGWDISWLGGSAGWLNGTAYPTWSGNSVITGHVYLPNGQPGPFVNLGTLTWGDRIIVHLDGQSYVYEVRQVTQINPNDTSVMGHRDQPWITLITCRGYNEATDTYAYRIAVQAVLVRVVNDYNPN
jgi:LPXTG-site transpeptidase (sortase) family protein